MDKWYGGPSDGAPINPTANGFMLDVERLPDFRRVIDQAIVALGGEGGGQGALGREE
jgi:hypothetical protein